MANMGPYLAEKYTKMIEIITNDLGRRGRRRGRPDTEVNLEPIRYY